MARRKHKPIHPGEVLKQDFLDPMGITPYRLAKETGISSQQIGRIISGSRGISGETALRFARFFSTSAAFWMNLQAHYELERAADEVGSQVERGVRPWRAA